MRANVRDSIKLFIYRKVSCATIKSFANSESLAPRHTNRAICAIRRFRLISLLRRLLLRPLSSPLYAAISLFDVEHKAGKLGKINTAGKRGFARVMKYEHTAEPKSGDTGRGILTRCLHSRHRERTSCTYFIAKRFSIILQTHKHTRSRRLLTFSIFD